MLIALTGCTAAGPSDAAALDGATAAPVKVTTTWTAPADPDAQGPSAAPELPEYTGKLNDAIALPSQMTITLEKIGTVKIKAKTPGEYSGTAVVVKVVLKNDSSESQSLDSAVVNLTSDGGQIGIPTWSAPSAPLHGEIGPRGSAEGTYVFMLDPAKGRDVTVSVNYAAGEAVAVFTGRTDK